MVMDNICHLLYNFLRCSAFQNIIFCWVMHEQPIIDGILSRLDLTNCAVKFISLVCDAERLKERLQRDIDNGVRQTDVIERSIQRIPLYEKLDTVRIDVSRLTAELAAEKISKL